MKEIANWEITLIELQNAITRYKVTRRNPEYLISETEVFENKQDAITQFEKWLDET